MAMTKVQVDTRNWNKKKRRTLRQAVKMGDDSVQTLTKLGMRHAKSIAPRHTGRTANLITRGVYTKKSDNTTSGRIISNTPKEYVHPTKSVGQFNLVRWMHTSPRARSHIKTGEPQYMYRTRGYLNRIKKRIAQSKKQQIKIK